MYHQPCVSKVESIEDAYITSKDTEIDISTKLNYHNNENDKKIFFLPSGN